MSDDIHADLRRQIIDAMLSGRGTAVLCANDARASEVGHVAMTVQATLPLWMRPATPKDKNDE